jgi:predicted phage terminase large subunit-like protein
MVFMPPGGAKSTYVSVCFPPWFMGRQPRRNVILATYASDLARKHGRRARAVVRQPVFGEVFKQSLSRATSAADEWSLTNDNEFMAAGIRSGITGNRADLIVIDDPIKGREQAESRLVRDKTWDEYKDSVRTRLKPGGRIVLVQTRWHEDDLAGRILPEDYDGRTGWVDCRDGEAWYVVSIPAEADRPDDPLGRARGELFWPQWFPPEHWTPFRLDPRTWASLCQQKPKPDEGSYFRKGWFERFKPEALPPGVHFYVTSDYATKDGSGDYTVHCVWAVDGKQDVWLVQVWRAQGTSDVWIEALIDLVAEYRTRGGGPVKCFGEKGVIWNAIEPALKRRMAERRTPFRVEVLSSQGGGKAERARGFQAMAREGRVRVADELEGDAFVDELAAFPAGKFDDQVDAASLIGRVFDRLGGLTRDRAAYAQTNDTFG